MSYIKFDKTLLNNLDKALTREFLQTNRNGAYMASTIVDCNTRKYHGYLVAPVPDVDGHNHVLLSSLDETIIQHGAEFNVGIHRYDETNFVPGGHKYIREFEADGIPTSIYRIGGVIMKKERLIMAEQDTVLIRYTILEAHSHTMLRLKPFLAFRGIHFLTHENSQVRKDYEVVENGISMSLYEKYPRLFMQLSRQAKFVYEPYWNKNVEYAKEQERGLYYKEDLFVPGYFELPLQAGESVVVAAGVEQLNPRTLKNLFNKELDKITPADNFEQTLRNASEQFFVEKEGKKYLLAGYPWFNFRVRDALLSLPGSTLALGKRELFEECFDVVSQAVYEYTESEDYTTDYVDPYVPDALLWLIWNIQQYAEYHTIEEAAKRYGKRLFQAIDFIKSQRHTNLFLHDNGLLYTDGKVIPATWMNATENEQPITPRTGYVVEINALWYNALRFGADVAKILGDEQSADMLAYQASITAGAFVKNFWNGSYLYDYIDGNYRDIEVRPNMICAVSLPYSPLTSQQQKSILDIVTRELLTLKGLRTISPKSGMYRPKYVGGMYERNRNYHNGPVWAFTIGAYAEAYMKVYKNSAFSFIRRFLAGFESELRELTVGTISELFDGNPPFKGHGAMAYAPTIAEILRTLKMLDKLKN